MKIADKPTLLESYLLVLDLPLRSFEGVYWADPLWHKDLFLHLTEIERISLLCPVEIAPPPADWLACDDPRLKIIAVPVLSRFPIRVLPHIVVKLWRAIGEHQIIHTGLAGWPFPLGWIASPIAYLRRRFLVIVVESSFWRASPDERRWRVRTKSRIFERINRWCLSLGTAGFFTTQQYLEELGSSSSRHNQVIAATWIDEEDVLSPLQITEGWVSKEPRLLYAGRLTRLKGVAVLLEAIAKTQVNVDLIGEGELGEECREFADRYPGRVRLLPPVTYGAAFFQLLDRYAALVVPSLSDEQPRVIADAFARGVPVVASATTGHNAFVRPGETGWLVAPGDSDALAMAMTSAVESMDRHCSLGQNARDMIVEQTHRAMHRTRAKAIKRTLLLDAGN